MQVVLATCSGAGDALRLQNERFRVVILDEATQATEPSSIIPLVRSREIQGCICPKRMNTMQKAVYPDTAQSLDPLIPYAWLGNRQRWITNESSLTGKLRTMLMALAISPRIILGKLRL